MEDAERKYRLARCSLRDFIRCAKRKAWEKLRVPLDEDPWDRPYKLVLRRLMSRASPMMKVVSPQFLEEIVEKLFPTGEQEFDPFPLPGPQKK